MLHRSTIQLLRFHFSLFLLPVYLFAVAEAPLVNIPRAILIFFILHFLVYPASNGYNSYIDRDETPIGGLAKPMQPTKQLFVITMIMDSIAWFLSLVVSVPFACGILLYILASRAYSWRKIRLKQFPVIGFLTVFFFQGAMIFAMTYHGVSGTASIPLIPALISSLLIGALYPLTQIYQHDEDKKDGVETLSMLLGKRGTFVFTAILFVTAAVLFFLKFEREERITGFYLFNLVMLPVLIFFFYWASRVFRYPHEASFKNSLRMSVISTLCTTIFFTILMFL